LLGLDYDEAFEEGDDEDMIHEHLDVAPALSSSTPMTTVKLSPTKTIMKSAEKETPLPKKSVRFSLRPGGSTITPASQQQVTIKAESSNEIITSDIVNQSDIGKNISFFNELMV
jgi:predicted transcriptional regulator